MEASYDGIKYIVDDPSFQWYINSGLSEPYPRELAIVKEYLNKYAECNNTCIDVGGHVGTTALPYSRLFKEVVAFEPNPMIYQFFKKNIELNNAKNITVYNKGVYNKTTNCVIAQHGPNSGCFYIKECEKNNLSIPVVRLDDINFTKPIDFIKIDTEGSELYVLEGAYNLISEHKPLLNIETNHCSEKFFGYAKEKIFEFLKSLDYKVLDDDGNNPLFYCK